MTVIVKIGRRVPRSLKLRIVKKIEGLLGFQENIWIMIRMSFKAARRKWLGGEKHPLGKLETFTIDIDKENEDTFHYLEWMTITQQGDKAVEMEEYMEAMKMYDALNSILRKMPKNNDSDQLKKVFKTKLLSEEKLIEAYEKGYGSEKHKNLCKILLEMGLVTHIELVEDWDTRVPTPDF